MKPIESKRVALDRKIVLRFPDFDGFVTDFAANLSMTGMFVRSKEPQKAGTPVSFELRLEDGAPLVRGSGWVVWARRAEEATDRPSGMGIEFTELDHKSRRLVRWMILSQLPDGQAPYDVHAGAAAAPAGLRARAGARRIGWTIALAALLVAGFAALVWWRGGPDRPSSRDARAVEGKNAQGRPDPGEQRTKPVGEPAPGNAAASAAGAASVASAAVVEGEVRDWARAWSDQDVDRYLAHYASDFEPEGGLSRSQWSAERTRRVTAPETIRVAVTRLETRMLPDGSARVSFLQTYRSDGYADTVDKVLELAFEDGRWRIRREAAD